MRLFPRLLINHLAVVAVMASVFLIAAEVAAHPFIAHHVDQMIRLIGPQGARLRPDLYLGMRGTLTWAMFTALPLALLVAALFWLHFHVVTVAMLYIHFGPTVICWLAFAPLESVLPAVRARLRRRQRAGGGAAGEPRAVAGDEPVDSRR